MCQTRVSSKIPDLLLSDFRHGTSRGSTTRNFNNVKEVLVPLVADCLASLKRQPSTKHGASLTSIVSGTLQKDLVKLQGLDEDAYWLGKTEHPYTWLKRRTKNEPRLAVP